MARDVRKESVNNLARFFVVRTAWAGSWSQSPQCLAWKVLSLERLERATSWELQRQSPGNAYSQGQLRYNVVEIAVFLGFFFLLFFLIGCHSALLPLSTMCLMFVVMLGFAHPSEFDI